MPFNTSGITTGLLGFTLKKEFLSEGLFYRETEVYDYEIYATPNAQITPFTDIQTYIKNSFSSYSGNVNVKVLNAPADYVFPNDSIRVAKFNVQVEVRKEIKSLQNFSSEILDNYYKGLDTGFFSSYFNILNDFKEEFGFETSEKGNSNFNHNISFTLQTGGKGKASEIASGLFSKDKDTAFGISTMVSGVTVADTANYTNYFTETYDLLRNSFSFSKRREILPFTSTYCTHNLNHSIEMKENGVIDVSERGSVLGNLTFDFAKQTASDLISNSFNRCNILYSTFKNVVAGASVSESLINVPINLNRVYNKPNLLVDYEVSFTNNPNIFIDPIGQLSFLREKTIEVEQDESKIINLSHTYNFTYLVNPIFSNIDQYLSFAYSDVLNNSQTEIDNYYSSNQFFGSNLTSLSRIKENINLPNRKKSFNIAFVYTNNPSYNVVLDGDTYSFLSYKTSENKPIDIVNEYKIINRPSKTSIITYEFQTEKGSKTISVTSQLERNRNVVINPFDSSDLSTKLLSLYKFAVDKFMKEIFGVSVFSLTYYLSDLKYQINSDGELGITVTIIYSLKKYIL